MLTVLWKYALMNWYKVDIMSKRKPFIKDKDTPHTVWGQAIHDDRRFCSYS
jgi:hypothetical protein